MGTRRSGRNDREDARAAVSDQQMRPESPRYPVDRYLVESSKKFELVNIIEDEIWNPEPALRPEDEYVLRKLHEMLQSTADDLKLLSGELSKFREPGVQVKMQPTPLDEEFNEKIHIEELVNAKFHGYKTVDKSPKLKRDNSSNSAVNNSQNAKIKSDIQVNFASVKKPVINRNLGITRTKVIEINENVVKGIGIGSRKLNNGKVINNLPAVSYNEFTFKSVEPKDKENHHNLQIQDMPSINIRSELKEQKVLQLDIIPESIETFNKVIHTPNIAVIATEHEAKAIKQVPKNYDQVYNPQVYSTNKQSMRKVSKMSICESSDSNNSSSDKQELSTSKQMKAVVRTTQRNSTNVRNKKWSVSKKEPEKRPNLNLDGWKRKLNIVYGQSISSRNSNVAAKTNDKKYSPKKNNLQSSKSSKPKENALNNTEYIPYSQLTLGGVPISDIEREIPDISCKNDVPLSPILDKILNSRENSFSYDSPRKSKKKDGSKILTTSDENLLHEVLNIEKTVSQTISKSLKKKESKNSDKIQKGSSSESGENNSYGDDFEEEKSDNTQNSKKNPMSNDNMSEQKDYSKSSSDENAYNGSDNDDENILSQRNIKHRTSTKISNLSFKNSVDIYEYIHAVDTQDIATQSNTTHKILPKETQTSPTNDTSNIQPIHNDLWPSIDPRGEVEKMFKLEKDFIKKLIIDEYGDLLEKSITKPSTSYENKKEDRDVNVHAFQKNTQTSPARVKSVMTSPTRTKTRTTSPFLSSLTVDHRTSPMIIVTNEEFKVDDANEGISFNLSSPRFNLRLPQTSRDILSNLEICSNHESSKIEKYTPSNETYNKPNSISKNRVGKVRKSSVSSSSSIDRDYSSSEISSLGEVKFELKRSSRKNRIRPLSESSSSSLISRHSTEVQSGSILPLRSEGELSVGQIQNSKSRSEGETSFGMK